MVDDNRGVNYSTCAITLTMATVFVGARMYCSIIKLGRWLYEDGILLVSLVSSVSLRGSIYDGRPVLNGLFRFCCGLEACFS